jgi:hypothetical protein
VFDEDSRDIPAGEDDDRMVILDDFVVSLCTYKTCGDEVAKLTMLQSRDEA